jgi:hypothetical protein
MKRLAAVAAAVLLLSGTMLFAQETKPRAYTLVLQGAF